MYFNFVSQTKQYRNMKNVKLSHRLCFVECSYNLSKGRTKKSLYIRRHLFWVENTLLKRRFPTLNLCVAIGASKSILLKELFHLSVN